jgi:adenine-specific DNA-methyltransferase
VIAIYPIDQDGIERRWNFGLDSIKENLNRITILEVDNTLDLFLTHEVTVPKSMWNGGRYDAGNYGNTLLINILGGKIFDFPKSINLVQDCINLILNSDNKRIVLDYFGGSGTTAHATINANRIDNGTRKYILVEMGEYFNTVTKPRIQKVIYSEDWKDGKPLSRKGSSHCFKYLRLESYEDSLNNLQLKRNTSQQSLLQTDTFGEDYLLHYMLETESRDSLLNLEMFRKPFGYSLKVTENNELKEQEVDLVETFNYLIGLVVQTMEMIRDTVVVQGHNLSGDKILVIWRDVDQMDNAALNEFFRKLQINTKDSEFKRIYVNGDNNLENLRTEDEGWKVVLIEEEFHRRMFEDS